MSTNETAYLALAQRRPLHLDAPPYDPQRDYVRAWRGYSEQPLKLYAYADGDAVIQLMSQTCGAVLRAFEYHDNDATAYAVVDTSVFYEMDEERRARFETVYRHAFLRLSASEAARAIAENHLFELTALEALSGGGHSDAVFKAFVEARCAHLRARFVEAPPSPDSDDAADPPRLRLIARRRAR